MPPGLSACSFQRQLREAVCSSVVRAVLTAAHCVIRRHGQGEALKAHALHHLRRVQRASTVFPAVCGDFCGQLYLLAA
ncbi:hypothetical protein DMH88_16065 [Escherichia coli]|nr:hypothetical protein [Escherichia coli]